MFKYRVSLETEVIADCPKSAAAMVANNLLLTVKETGYTEFHFRFEHPAHGVEYVTPEDFNAMNEAQTAFTKAVMQGRLTLIPGAATHIDNYMYMGNDPVHGDKFKNRDTREYLPTRVHSVG